MKQTPSIQPKKNPPTPKEKRYQAMIENSYDVVARVDAQGMFTYVSSSVKRILGYEYKDLVGKSAFHYIHPDDLHLASGKLREVATTPKAQAKMTLRFKHKNKSWRWVEASVVNLLHDPDVESIVGSFHDVTAQKQFELDLQESKDRYKRLVENTGVIPWEAEFDATHYSYIGPQVEKLTGYAQKDWYQPKFWRNHLHPDDRDRAIKSSMNYSKIRNNFVQEYRILDKKGHVVWLRDIVNVEQGNDGRKILRGFLIDITADKLAEQTLEESELKFRDMADSATVMIWVTDISGFCTYVNKRWTEYTGQSFEEALGNGWLKPVHQNDLWQAKDKFSVAVKKKQPFRTTYRLKGKDGNYRWFMDNGRPTNDVNGKTDGFIGTVADIHDQIELDRKKDEFMSVASHELKTPVTSLKAYTQLLQREFIKSKSNPHALTYLDKMDLQINKLTNLILDLLDVSRIESGKLQFRKKKVALLPIVRDTIESIQATTTDHSIVLQGKTRSSIAADADRISQIIINLLTNAIKYSPAGSKIIVTVQRDNTTIIVSVKDFGTGMTNEQQKHVFERFYQVGEQSNKHTPGLGIGLYISQELAIRHGGKIEVISKQGKGSTFYLKLPIWGKKTL